MGWNVSVLKNTLRMDIDVAEDLEARAGEHGHAICYSDEDGIEFDPDAAEHMDFLWEEWADEILSDPSTTGEVIFYSAEGDDRGEAWGYRYENGKKTTLRGKLVFVENEGEGR